MNRAEAHQLIKKIINRFFFIDVSLFLCVGFLWAFSATVFAKDQETVKVGYYFSHNFQEGTDDNSPKSGYSYEYLQKIASYTGWKYEYVYGDWKELFEKLKKGEIDLMAGVAYSKAREEFINYS